MKHKLHVGSLLDRKKSAGAAVGLLLLLSGCGPKSGDDQLLSQRYVHKYGYAVSAEEWKEKSYPGQVISHLQDGTTVTATYEQGVLHGAKTTTFPHSQTIASYLVYNEGQLVKETHYDQTGLPLWEKVHLDPSRHSLTTWYATGTPARIEEYAGEEFVEVRSFTLSHETEARVEAGEGMRVVRSREGVLISRERVEKGAVVLQETFFSNGAPEFVAHYRERQLHGERRVFAATGEPLAIEEWVEGRLHGLSTYFKNGAKYLETFYLDGRKSGVENHYIDGEVLCQQVYWEDDRKHGPSIFYADGQTQTHYFYEGRRVSPFRYRELSRLDGIVMQTESESLRYQSVE